MKSVFIVGGTGYIGGEVLFRILNACTDEVKVTAMVRSQEKAQQLKEDTNNKISTIVGSLDDLDLIRKQISENEIVINAASNNHMPSLEVIKEELVKKKKSCLFIQTSGAAVVAGSTDPKEYNPEKVYSDVDNIEEINNLSENRPHRKADKLVMEIESLNPAHVKTVIISPSTVYGIGNGWNNKISIQIPWMARAAVAHGSMFVVHKGDTRWSNVHISDFGDLYILILKRYLSGQEFASGTKGYYFGEGGRDHYWRDVSARASQYLFERKKLPTAELEQVMPEELLEKYKLPALFYGSNCRVKADLARTLGWSPSRSSDLDFNNDIKESIDFMINQGMI